MNAATAKPYFDRFPNIAFEQRGAVLMMRLHGDDGGPLQWGSWDGSIHTQLPQAFYAVAHDPSLRAVIITGTGDTFCTTSGPGRRPDFSADYWRRIWREGRDLLMNLLEIDAPVITAVNGPAIVHPELCVLADVVLSVEAAWFQDSHIPSGVTTGDGCHVVWRQVLGPTRGNYFHLMEEKLTAREAMRLGAVHEIVPADQLLARAWAVGEQIAAKNEVTTRHTRMLFTRPFKAALQADLDFGLAAEGLDFALRNLR